MLKTGRGAPIGLDMRPAWRIFAIVVLGGWLAACGAPADVQVDEKPDAAVGPSDAATAPDSAALPDAGPADAAATGPDGQNAGRE